MKRAYVVAKAGVTLQPDEIHAITEKCEALMADPAKHDACNGEMDITTAIGKRYVGIGHVTPMADLEFEVHGIAMSEPKPPTAAELKAMSAKAAATTKPAAKKAPAAKAPKAKPAAKKAPAAKAPKAKPAAKKAAKKK